MKKRTGTEDCGTDSSGNPSWQSIPIRELNLDAETQRILAQAGIGTVRDIIEAESGRGLQKIGGIWQKQYRDIQSAMLEIGVPLDGGKAKLRHKEKDPPVLLATPVEGAPIEELALSHETYTVLKNAGINTVQKIIETEKAQGLLRVRDLGKKHYLDIQEALLEIGIAPDGSTAIPSAQKLEAESEPPPSVKPLIEVKSWPGMEYAHLRTVAFVDYEHWYVGLKTQHMRKPNIQAWFDNAKQRGRLLEVTFFGDFSEDGGMCDEINNIRRFTNRIIETKNINAYSKKDFTDFIMLDNIYQKVIASPEIDQVMLFTGDGHFSSVASYLRIFCSKVVGVYSIDNASSSQLEATADWCVRLPLDVERYMECREAILSNLRYAEAHSKKPMFRMTVRLVAEHYSLDEDLVEAGLRRLIEEGVVYSVSERSRRDYNTMLNILKVNWNMVDSLSGNTQIHTGGLLNGR